MWYGGKVVLAHRYAYMQAHGLKSLTSKQFICHHCDNPPCVNPEHLFLGDQTTNMADKMRKGRHRWPKGSEHGRSKLTEADAQCIRACDVSANILGVLFGVHPQHIRLIRREKRVWLHV